MWGGVGYGATAVALVPVLQELNWWSDSPFVKHSIARALLVLAAEVTLSAVPPVLVGCMTYGRIARQRAPSLGPRFRLSLGALTALLFVHFGLVLLGVWLAAQARPLKLEQPLGDRVEAYAQVHESQMEIVILLDRSGTPTVPRHGVWQVGPIAVMSCPAISGGADPWRYSLSSPLGLLVVFTCVPAALLVTNRQYRSYCRRRRRLCQGCGYDLRGNVSGRCPECGALIDVLSGHASS